MAQNLSEKMARWAFVSAIATSVLLGVFALGALAHRNNIPPVPQVLDAYRALFGSDSDIVEHPRRHHLQPSRGQGSGVTVNKVPDDGAYVMMAGFFDEENQIRLVNRDGSVFRKWSLNYLEHFPSANDRACNITRQLRVDTHGAHITPKGEVVFNYEYCGTVKLDQCGEVVWSINKPTHHSLEPAEAGGYWILGRYHWLASEYPDRFPPFSTPASEVLMQEDTLLRIDANGEVLEEFSIPQLMRDGGLEAILSANRGDIGLKRIRRTELVHSNRATELGTDIADAFPLFEAGDLAISIRDLNLVMVVDPVSRTIKWHQIGPWLRQHDPEFRTDGRISIFNNNVYYDAYHEEQTVLSTPRTTNIIAVDPVTRNTEVIFGERPGQEMLSVVRGQHELLDNGGMVIIEFDAGRVLEVDERSEIVWEYVNYYDEEFVGEVIDADVLPADYFEAEWETCSQ